VRPFRAITRAITPGQSGGFTVTRGQSTEGDAVRRRDKTAGQRLLTCGLGGGQGRGRTADLPIFRPNWPVRGGRFEPNLCSGEGRVVPYSSVIQKVVLANPLADRAVAPPRAAMAAVSAATLLVAAGPAASAEEPQLAAVEVVSAPLRRRGQVLVARLWPAATLASVPAVVCPISRPLAPFRPGQGYGQANQIPFSGCER
jgi:hypothetical protein